MRVLSPVTNSTLPFVYDVSKSDYQKLNHSFLYKIHVTDVYSTLANKYTFAIRPRVCPAGFSFKDTKCVCDSTIAGVLRYLFDSITSSFQAWVLIFDLFICTLFVVLLILILKKTDRQ